MELRQDRDCHYEFGNKPTVLTAQYFLRRKYWILFLSMRKRIETGTEAYFYMMAVQQPRPMSQQLVYLIQISDFLRYKVDAIKPFQITIVMFELDLLLFDEEKTFVSRCCHQCNVVPRVVGQCTLAVHQVVVKVQKVFEKLGLKAHYLYDMVDFAVLCIELIEKLGNLKRIRNNLIVIHYAFLSIRL
jgi:hypothetical protein